MNLEMVDLCGQASFFLTLYAQQVTDKRVRGIAQSTRSHK